MAFIAATCRRSLITNKVGYRLDLYLIYLLIYLKHNGDALPKTPKKGDCFIEPYTIVKTL
jgi:hypothetical protein